MPTDAKRGFNLFDWHPASILGRLSARRAESLAEDRMAHLPPHLRADIGLEDLTAMPPDERATLAMRQAGRWA